MTAMTHGEAYRKGWAASKRTTTYDMDSAYYRFVRNNKIGDDRFEISFTDGWIDYAAGNSYSDMYAADWAAPTGQGQG